MKNINDELQKRLNDREAEGQMLRQEVAILKGANNSLAMEKEDFNRKFELLKLDKACGQFSEYRGWNAYLNAFNVELPGKRGGNVRKSH